MHIHHLGSRIRGFSRIAQFGHLWSMTPNDAQHRLQILEFWATHGAAATHDAYQVSRRTLYRWKQTGHPSWRESRGAGRPVPSLASPPTLRALRQRLGVPRPLPAPLGETRHHALVDLFPIAQDESPRGILQSQPRRLAPLF